MESYKTLIEVAQRETGLNDFGGDTFREGLEVLVGSLNSEARLNAVGESALRSRIVQHLSQRLQVEDWYRRHPEIEDVELLPPLFGISLPRTGSTALSFLLSSDPGIRYLRVWESDRPCPPPSTVDGPDPRRGQVSESNREAGKQSHTPSGIDGAMECLDILSLDFKSQMFVAFARIPAYARWLIDSDMTPTYLYERRVIKLLQWGEPVRPWRLKTPQHLLFLDHLDRAFPDARFVMTHRDPTDVMVSVGTVFASISANFTDDLDYQYIGDVNLAMWTTGMRRAIAFREAGNEHRFYDIHFRGMHKDPVGEVRGLYNWLGEPVSQAFEDNMAAWWNENAGRDPSVHVEPAMFGYDLDAVRGQFSDYLERMARWTAGRNG